LPGRAADDDITEIQVTEIARDRVKRDVGQLYGLPWRGAVLEGMIAIAGGATNHGAFSVTGWTSALRLRSGY
jgi:hypothetical protein